jgi:hypothetical protein
MCTLNFHLCIYFFGGSRSPIYIYLFIFNDMAVDEIFLKRESMTESPTMECFTFLSDSAVK